MGSLQVPDLCREDKGDQREEKNGRDLRGDPGVQLRGCVRGSLLPLLLSLVQLGGRNSLQAAPVLETASIPMASEDSYQLLAGAILT